MSVKGWYREDYAKSARAALLRWLELEGNPPHKEAARRLGISSGTISKVSSGVQHMQLGLAIALAAKLGVTVDDILLREGRPASTSADPNLQAAEVDRVVRATLAAVEAERRGSRITERKR